MEMAIYPDFGSTTYAYVQWLFMESIHIYV